MSVLVIVVPVPVPVLRHASITNLRSLLPYQVARQVS
jgi:hypothetical protein